MALTCAREGSAWILGKPSSPKEWLGTGTGCPEGWRSHCPWRCQETCRFDTKGHGLVGNIGGGWTVGQDDPGGLFLPS